jgi:uncharacterized protein RhaS with RHS repeats
LGDYGVRKYDADIGRFLSVDPLYEMYPGYTTYGYSGNDPLNMLDPSGAAIEVIDGVSTYMQGLITVYGSFTGEGFEDPFFMTLGYGSGGGGGIISSMTLVGQEPAADRNYLQEMMDRSAAQGWAFVSSSGREYMGRGSVYQNSSGRGGGGGSSNGSGNSGSSGSSILSWVQTGLDVVGLIPAVGEVADGINAVLYLANGDYLNAGLSTAAMIPFAGWGATAAKVGIKGKKALTAAKTVINTSGWVVRKVFNKLDPAIQKKVAAAIEKGIVAPTDAQGIIKLTASEAKSTGYSYKIKILGKGGDIRIYGNPNADGHIIFDKVIGH